MGAAINTLQDISVDINDLLFDPNNPRYQGDFSDFVFVPYDQYGDDAVQTKAYQRITSERFGVKLLAESIAEIGYLKIDNIVITPYKTGKYIVIEGNRRLAALKMIIEGKVKTDLEKKSFVEIPAQILTGTQEDIAVDQWIIQGARHIGGVKPWGPYQKNRALQILMRDRDLTFSEAASALGLKKSEVTRSIKTLKVYEELLAHPFFGKKAKPEHYSFIEEMIKKPILRDYFSWDNKKLKFRDPQKRDFFFRLFLGGPGDDKPKISYAQGLRELPEILISSEARTSFEDFNQSFETAIYIIQQSRYNNVEKKPTIDELILQIGTRTESLIASDIKLNNQQKKSLVSIIVQIGNLVKDSNG